MKKIIIKKIPDSHGDGRVWMVMLPNRMNWWTHLYVRTFGEACDAVIGYQP